MRVTGQAFVANAPKERARLTQYGWEEPKDGELLIEVTHSSLNYKDAVTLTGTRPIARRYPIVAGVDLAGRVAMSRDESFAVGDSVVVLSSGLGEDRDGGYGDYSCVSSSACLRLGGALDLSRSMAIGTAGLTAMLSVEALFRNGSKPQDLGDRSVLVTGASGGVGTMSVVILSSLGYRVVASTGRVEQEEFLRHLGAHEVINRASLLNSEGRLLNARRYGAAVDVAGGATLSSLLTMIHQNGTVAATGLVDSSELHVSVFPFILRGVTLAGINAVHPPIARRSWAWERLCEIVPVDLLDDLTTRVSRAELVGLAEQMLSGQVRGRVVVNIADSA